VLLAATRPGTASAGVGRDLEPPAAELATEPTVARPLDLNSIAVLDFRNLQGDPQYAWMGSALRVAFNTELTKVGALRVYAPELIDRAVSTSGSGSLETAQQMGIEKLIEGSFQIVGNGIRIDAQIVDTGSGIHEGSDSVEGTLPEFFELQKRLVLSMLRRLRVRVSAGEGQSIEQDTNTDVDAYRLLLQSEGLLKGATPSPAAATPPSDVSDARDRIRPPALERLSAVVVGVAYADDGSGGLLEQAQQLLERYRRALEEKNLDALAGVYASFPPAQREAVRAYLQNADNLTVTIADIAVQVRGADVILSYTRKDRFVDHKTGRAVHLEVRLTKVLLRENATWRIAS